ncbi:MAG: hypothetical protein O3C27_08285, partial [Actinomycetota bacterium]|nr:hypothetical protein [Actinomycetota bacterium]
RRDVGGSEGQRRAATRITEPDDISQVVADRRFIEASDGRVRRTAPEATDLDQGASAVEMRG